MASVAAAYPFIEVKIDTSALQPVAQRSPGVIAVVGETGGAGTATANRPFVVETLDDAAQLFATVGGGGAVTPTTLFSSLQLAMLQDPKPSKIYGVKLDNATKDWDAALGVLDSVDDVDFVSLANVVDPALLVKLKQHAENNSAQGQKRIAVAMVDPTTARTPTYAADLLAKLTGTPNLQSSVSRMVMVAARGAVTDLGAQADTATAAMAAIAGYEPQVSMVLKRLRGISMPQASQFTASEIKALSEGNVIPIIQPSLIVGGGFYFGEGRLFTSDASQLYIDLVRVLDEIDFALKAGLIGSIGDARITQAGLSLVRSRIHGILGPLKTDAVIDDYAIRIPVADILGVPAATWSPGDAATVAGARANRAVDVFVSITYGPAVHLLKVTLQPKF
jgi:hypothetical protein